MHEKIEVFVGSVIYSDFQMDVLDGNSLSINVSLVSFTYFFLYLFLLIHMTIEHKLFKDYLLNLRAELLVQTGKRKTNKKKVIYLFFLFFNSPAGIAWGRDGNM